MSRTSSPLTPSVRLGLLLFAALPCSPGFLFLLAGAWCDPHWRGHDPSPAGQARSARAWEQTRELYLAGGVVLLVGTVGTGFVVWKIARPGPPFADEAWDASAKSEEV